MAPAATATPMPMPVRVALERDEPESLLVVEDARDEVVCELVVARLLVCGGDDDDGGRLSDWVGVVLLLLVLEVVAPGIKLLAADAAAFL